jgi:hypothetical protein
MSRERIIVTTPAASMTPRRARWLFRDSLPLGMFSLLAGREGVGKSCLAAEFVACVTTGEAVGDLIGRPASAMYVAAEDSWEHTVIPRLLAAGADLSRVHQVRVREGASIGDPSLPTDIDALETQIRELGVRLVVLDPVISRLDSGLDTHRDSDVRRALEPLARLAERTDAAILGIIHVSKTDTADPLTSVMGSRAFAATARAVLFAVKDADTNLLCFAKSNLGPPQRSRSYTIEGITVGKDPDDGQPITAGAVKWTGVCDRRAEDVLEDQAASRPRSTQNRTKAWLRGELGDGPVAAGELKARAAAAGIPERTLARAAKDLGVVQTRKGFGGGSTWALPDEEAGQPLVGQGLLPPEQGLDAPGPSEGTGLADGRNLEDDLPEAAPPYSCQKPLESVYGMNGMNGVIGMNELEPPTHSRHSRQSGHAGGDEIGGVIEPWEAGPARPDAARTAAAPSLELAAKLALMLTAVKS